MIWDASHDDYLGKCGAGPNPLLTTIAKGLGIVSKDYGVTIGSNMMGSAVSMCVNGVLIIFILVLMPILG